MDAVELQGITKTFGSVVAVDDLSLRVPAGSVYGFIGPNGSGKTTTLRMIMNIFQPDRGTIRVLGESLHGSSTDRVGYMPEERGLYKRMKVRELLRFYGELKGGRDVRAQVDVWLERLDLAAWADRKVETLSKGMAQKVQFIATVVSGPELVVLDEPFSGLDPVNQDVLRDAVLELRDAGATVVFSTHDMDMAERVCDFVFMIFRGRKVLDGTLASIQDRYGSDTVRFRVDGGPLRETRLTDGQDPQSLLRQLAGRSRVELFELTRPSLHDIFVRIAAPRPEEVANA